MKKMFGISIWTKESFEMKAYKFYQDEAAQKGEIIYLDGLLEVSDMKIPKARAWYRTEKNEFLGTDIFGEGLRRSLSSFNGDYFMIV